MGLYKYYDPVTGTRKPIKSGSIVNMDGTNEYTPDEVKEMDDKIGILSGTSGTKEKANKSDFDSHKEDNATTSQKGHIYIASESEALVGENNTKAMTPLRTKQAIDEALEDRKSVV